MSSQSEDPDLSDEEFARAAQSREVVMQLMPELMPFLTGLVKEGYRRGWRDIYAYRLDGKANREGNTQCDR